MTEIRCDDCGEFVLTFEGFDGSTVTLDQRAKVYYVQGGKAIPTVNYADHGMVCRNKRLQEAMFGQNTDPHEGFGALGWIGVSIAMGIACLTGFVFGRLL